MFGTADIPADGSISSIDLILTNLSVPTNVVFGFSGTDVHGNQWSEKLTIPFDGPQTPLIVGGASNAASGQQWLRARHAAERVRNGAGKFRAIGGHHSAAAISGRVSRLRVNGVTASLYYVSPDQVNLQIPYETQPGYRDAYGGQSVRERQLHTST